MPAPALVAPDYTHRTLTNGSELAVERLPQRSTIAIVFRMLTGAANDPADQSGLAALVERTLAKHTANYSGRELADQFDQFGIQWSSACGRQTTVFSAVCLPEFLPQTIALFAEMIVRPTFPDDVCNIALQLARDELRQLEDEPGDLLRIDLYRNALGPVLGRYPGGDAESLARITPATITDHWRNAFASGKLQVAAAGNVDPDALAELLEAEFADFGSPARAGRDSASVQFAPGNHHREKKLKQQYLAFALPGADRAAPEFPIEQVFIAVLSGGMSSRLFTEVREKQGLVYWVGCWHLQPRGAGQVYFGASTTPERCQRTYDTLQHELRRLPDDLTDEETNRAKNSLIAHWETESDITRARAGLVSEDLFHFGEVTGLDARIQAVRAVTTPQVREYAAQLRTRQQCVAAVGPTKLQLQSE